MVGRRKARLIDSILRGYPIPLILFAEFVGDDGRTYYEVLDGMQRLNAIVGFIENEYPVSEKYFDITQLARAQQAEKDGFLKHTMEMLSTPLLFVQIC